MDTITVDLASDAEARACLALLPEARGAGAELLIARCDGVLAGAAAIGWQSWSRPSGFPTQIHVVPSHRRLGVGRRLLAAAADLAREETDGLWSFAPSPDDAPAAAFMTACGCRRMKRRHHFEGDLGALLADITPLLDRLRRRPAFQAPAIVPLAEAPLDEIAWLVSRELGGGPMGAMARLRHETRAGSADRSQAAITQGEVAGVILWRRDADDGATVSARVVGARWRGGPVNLLLLEAGLRAGQAEGVARVRFHCDEDVVDTLALARRAQAREVSVTASWYYPFDGDSRPSSLRPRTA